MSPMKALGRGQWGFDVAVAAVFAVVGQYELRFLPDSGHQGGPLALNTGLVLLAVAPLAIRRCWPLAALAVAAVPQAAASLFTEHAMTFWGMGVPMAILCYSVARWSIRRKAALSALGLAALVMGTYGIHVPAFVNVEDYVFGGLFLGACVLAGSVIAQLTRQREALDAAMVLLRGHEADRRLQVLADERTRIAREMHDVMAHGVTLMVVQAGAARMELAPVVDMEPSPGAHQELGPGAQKARDSLLIVEQTGRDVLNELRRTVHLLRNEEAAGSAEPAPNLAALAGLAASMKAAGLDVHLVVEQDLVLDAGRALTVYRVVQEALTNTLRHAGPGSVTVTVSQPGQLHIDVVDNCSGTGPRFPAAGGNGLAGMRERVAMFGGHLVAGPEPRGFAVRARIPVEPPP